jgi:hypothetical protein
MSSFAFANGSATAAKTTDAASVAVRSTMVNPREP